MATRPISSSTIETAWLEEAARSLGGSGAASSELLSIAAEQDPELLAGALFSFASRHAEDPSAIALTIYRRIADHPEHYGAASARLANSRSEALQGRGTFGQRSEIFFSHFAREAADPANLAGMVIAGAAFQSLRLVASSRLLASSSSNFFTRGLGARFIANGLAFTAEAPIFSASVRGINTLIGRRPDWSASALAHELAAGYLMLGGLRLSGAIGNSAIRRLDPAAALGGSFQQRLVQQASMLTGITAAHWAEQRLGFRPDNGGDALLADSLATLLHFNISGRLLHGLGAGRLNQEMDLRQRNLENLRPSAPFLAALGLDLGPRLVLAGHAPLDPVFRPEPLQMSTQVPEGGRSRTKLSSAGAENKSNEVIASRRDPEIHDRYLQAMHEATYLINRLVYFPPPGAPLWIETSLHVARFVAENCRADIPRVPTEHRATLELIAQRLDQLQANLELMRNSGNPLPPMDEKANVLMGHIYRVPNPLVNYIDNGTHGSLLAAARSALEANDYFVREYLPLHGVNGDSGETSPELIAYRGGRRAVKASNRAWSDDSIPFYDFPDPVETHLDIVSAVPRNILLLGEVPRERAELALTHEVKVSQIPRRTFASLLAEANRYQDSHIGLLNPSDKRTFEYVEAFNAFDAATLLGADGRAVLENSFFGRIQPGGIGLWISNDAKSMETLVQTALNRHLADVIIGSYQGGSPLKVAPQEGEFPGTDFSTASYVFFKKLAQE